MDSKKEILTQAQVDAELTRGEKVTLNDGGNLRLVIRSTGKGSWKYSGRLAGTGELVNFTLGKAEVMTLKQARKARALKIAELARGINSNAQKRARKSQEKEPTFYDVAEQWYLHWKDSVAPKTAQAAKGRLNNHVLPAIGMKKFADVTRADYAAIVTSLPGETPKSTAYKVCSMLVEIEKYAIDFCKHGGNRADGLTRQLHGQAHKIKHQPAITTLPELKEALNIIERFFRGGTSGPYIRYVLKLETLTGLRIGSLTALEWSFLDMGEEILRLPAGYEKNKMPLDLPLATQSIKIFRELYQFKTGSRFIFPSNNKGGHITGEGVLRAVKKLNLPSGLKNHGWRSIFISFAQEYGLPRKLLDELLNHKQGSAVTLAYDRAAYLPQKKAIVEWYANFLDAVREGTAIPAIPPLGGMYQY